MKDAELSLRKTTNKLPDDIRQRFISSSPFSEEDRSYILKVAAKALEQLTQPG
jgi:hypothetical protein